MMELVNQSQELKRKYISITSIPGASKITAITMICYMPELGSIRHKEISSLAGTAPFNRDSGFSKGKRCIQGGRSQVRKVLHMCILNPSYGLVDKERHRNRRLFGLHGVGNQNRKNMN